MKKLALVLFVLGLVSRGDVLGADIKLSGLVYAQYELVISPLLMDGTASGDQNSFDVNRTYLNVDAKFSDTLKGFLQYEVNLLTRDATTNSVFLKQALLEVNQIYPQAKLMVGLIPNSWRGYEEGIWKQRYAVKILDDLEGLLPATDRGIRVSGKIPYVDYDLAVTNGEGTKANEVKGSKYKDYMAKAAIVPFQEGSLAGLKINAYLQEGSYAVDQPRDRFFSGVSYENKIFHVMATMYSSRDIRTSGGALAKGSGESIHGSYVTTPRTWVFGRFDQWDPDTQTDNDARTRWIGGVGFKVADGVRASVDYQALTRQMETATSANERLASTHLEFKF